MLEVYKFWGIGNNFSRMLNLITTGRNATIMFDDGTLSRQFLLETGAPQGNSPSPLQYNFCEQIAILKLELDPRISSIFTHFDIPRHHQLHLRGDEGGVVQDLAEQLINDPVGGPGPIPVPLRVPVPGPARAPVAAYEFLPGVANIDIIRGAHQIPNLDPFSMESNWETDKVESFADDKTVTFLATLEGLSTVR